MVQTKKPIKDEDDFLEDNPFKRQLDISQNPFNSINHEAMLYEVLMKKEENKVKLLTDFISNKLQKTEITKSERKILPILEILAYTPFPDIADNSINPDSKPITPAKRKELFKEFEIPFLQKFLIRYGEYGIPVNRKGRKEEVEVFKSFLSDSLEINQKDNKSNFQ